MAVRYLIDVRAGVEWARAMAAWVLLTNNGAPSEDSYKVFIHCLRMAHLATMGAKLNSHFHCAHINFVVAS